MTLVTDIESLISDDPYGFDEAAKAAKLLPLLNRLTSHHAQGSPEFARIVDSYFGHRSAADFEDLPFLPVRIFKRRRLSSVSPDDEYKVLTSSGTTSQIPSQIVLDRPTARLQRQALSKLVQSYLGPNRLPMLIVDSESILRDRNRFSARAAGILGMMNFGRKHVFALDSQMKVDLDAIRDFVEEWRGQPVLIFGFTFMVYQHLFGAMKDAALRFDDALLVHSGGWKKLIDRAVDRQTFNRLADEQAGIGAVHNFYGMVEQVGSVFLDCEAGHFHASDFSQVLVREPGTWRVLEDGEEGLIQVMSALPLSYPGYSILTEDRGRVVHRGRCSCGREGVGFVIEGRLPEAEIRGCSDTYAEDRA